MSEISNKTLATLLVAAIVVSLGGTLISMNRLGQVQVIQYTGAPTGFAANPNGTVSLNVQQLLSIVTSDDNSIDFGTCTPSGGALTEEASDASTTNQCGSVDDIIHVRNNGNQKANVTVSINNTGEAHTGSLIPSPSTSSYIAFKAINNSAQYTDSGCSGTCEGGCENAVENGAWTNFSDSGSANKFDLCRNLTTGTNYNSIAFVAMIGLPGDAQEAGSDAEITFWAANSQ